MIGVSLATTPIVTPAVTLVPSAFPTRKGVDDMDAKQGLPPLPKKAWAGSPSYIPVYIEEQWGVTFGVVDMP